MPDDTKFKEMAPRVMGWLMTDFELDDVQAAGILGNIGHECAGFHLMHEVGQPEGKGGYGWAQWTGARREKFFAFCNKNSVDWKSDDANYGYLKEELSGSESNAISAVLKTLTLKEAAAAFERNFERAGVPLMERRERWAQIAIDAFRGTLTG